MIGVDKDVQVKVLKNSLVADRLVKLSSFDRKMVVDELLKNKTSKELACEVGVSETTIHDWKTMRNIGRSQIENISLLSVYHKLKSVKVEDVTDWGRVLMIKEECDRLLSGRKGVY